MNDLISVIVPVYNVEGYVGRCIESIQKQTYKNLEIILINDGSKDNSLTVCRKYASQDSRIKVISQQNAGVSAARNAGLDICTGGFVVFVDSDDYIHQEYIEYLFYLLKQNGCKISQIQYTYVYDEPTEHLWEAKVSSPTQSLGIEVVEKKWTFQELFTSRKRSYRAIVCGKLFSIDLFNSYRFPVGKIYEDEEASFMLSYQAKDIVTSSKHMYYYYMSQGSIMRNEKKYVNWDFLDLHKGIISFLENRNEELLLNSERKELCIRLMLSYFKGVKNNYKNEETKRLKDEFDAQYKKIKRNKSIPFCEWIAISLFYRFPSTVSAVQNATGFVQKVKLKRVQNSK